MAGYGRKASAKHGRSEARGGEDRDVLSLGGGVRRGLTELVFVVDESGSMYDLASDTVGGFNSTLERNRRLDGEANVSVVFFSDRSRVAVDRRPIREVRPLGRGDYRPGGCTALLDALGGAISHTAKVQSYQPDGYRAEHVVFVVITDGLENASHRYGYGRVRRMVEGYRRQGWEFVFLGANIDAAAEAGQLGIGRDHVAQYVSDSDGMALAYDAVAEATCAARDLGCVPTGWNDRVNADARRRG
ncbi:MAG: VWA domain-containing protein [Parafannyhessea sp.]|uniref:vWA domain-containing protein n=1 Tax=Parafannyhessea sp. TaxID=2847324 RepID=UPI003F11A76E